MPSQTDFEGGFLIPINNSDVPFLENFLKTTDPFLTSGIVTNSPYRLIDYIYSTRLEQTQIRVLIDRNLTSRIIRLANGTKIENNLPDNHPYRVAAACMAFFITAGVEIEPNIALYELEDQRQSGEANAELSIFRLADNIHPQPYLNIALGRDLVIPHRVINPSPSQNTLEQERNFSVPLTHWRRHHLVLTKIALLARNNTRPTQKVKDLIDWSVKDGFFDNPALTFSIIYFGKTNPGKMLKGVKSNSYKKCIEGIRNATWDLTYLSYWTKNVHKDKNSRLWIFATNDHALKRIGRALLAPDDDASCLQALQLLFKENWAISDATILLTYYKESLEKIKEIPIQRKEEIKSRMKDIEKLTNDLQQELRETFFLKS